MFDAPCARIPALTWTAIGPGTDARVLLESSIRLNGILFRLLAFRVPMPWSAGWTAHAAWEDDKGLHMEGLLWDVPGFRTFVRTVDAMPEDSHDLVAFGGIPPGAGEPGRDLAAAWQAIASRLEWSGQDWKPGIIGGEPYIILGHPAPAPRPEPGAAITLDGQDARSTPWHPEGVAEFNLDIEGCACVLRCITVRALEDGSGVAVRPLSADTASPFKLIGSLNAAIPGAGPLLPVRIGGKSVSGLIVPADTAAWAFDAAAFIGAGAEGLVPGRTGFWMHLPMRQPSPALAALLDYLAERVRKRRLGRIGGQAYAVFPVGRNADGDGRPAGCGSALEAEMTRLMLHVIGMRADGSLWLYSGRACQRLYLIAGTAYVNLSPALIHALEHVPGDAAAEMFSGLALAETTLPGAVDLPPAWTDSLPPVVDTPIRELLASLSGA